MKIKFKNSLWILYLLSAFACTSGEEKDDLEETVSTEEENKAEVDEEAEEELQPEPAPQPVETAPAPEPPPPPPAPTAVKAGFDVGNYLYVNRSGLKVRKGPGFDHSVTKILTYGRKVTVQETNNLWIKIGEEEWVSKKGLTPHYTYTRESH